MAIVWKWKLAGNLFNISLEGLKKLLDDNFFWYLAREKEF